jgi:hypothetical protein
MQGGRVPKRILNARWLREVGPWNMPRYRSVDAVRMPREWLADPAVPDELRRGDAEVLSALRTYLAENEPPRMTIVTRAMLALESRDGETPH